MMDVKQKGLFGAIGVLVGIVMIVFLGSYVVPKALVTLLTRADTNQVVSVKNSLLIGQKMVARADGQEKCVVNVFVLDSDGKGVKGKSVQLSGLGSLDAVTDSMGKATFELTSTTAQQYELSAQVGGKQLSGTVTVTFR